MDRDKLIHHIYKEITRIVSKDRQETVREFKIYFNALRLACENQREACPQFKNNFCTNTPIANCKFFIDEEGNKCWEAYYAGKSRKEVEKQEK